MLNEVIRIADGKPLKLELQLVGSTGNLLNTEYPGEAEYLRIMWRATSFRDYANICIHILKPTFWNRRFVPFPRQVRNICRR